MLRRRFLTNINLANKVPYNEIWYTTTDKKRLGNEEYYDFTAISSYAEDSGKLSFPYNITNIDNNMFRKCDTLVSVTFPDSIMGIGSYVFHSCSKLANIDFGSAITSLGAEVFSACTSLTGIVIPDTVTTMGNYVFLSCTNLKNVTLGKKVAKLGAGTFQGCTGVTSLYCRAELPPEIVSTSLSGLPSSCKIYVPKSLVTSYKGLSYWNDYTIVGYDF